MFWSQRCDSTRLWALTTAMVRSELRKRCEPRSRVSVDLSTKPPPPPLTNCVLYVANDKAFPRPPRFVPGILNCYCFWGFPQGFPLGEDPSKCHEGRGKGRRRRRRGRGRGRRQKRSTRRRRRRRNLVGASHSRSFRLVSVVLTRLTSYCRERLLFSSESGILMVLGNSLQHYIVSVTLPL